MTYEAPSKDLDTNITRHHVIMVEDIVVRGKGYSSNLGHQLLTPLAATFRPNLGRLPCLTASPLSYSAIMAIGTYVTCTPLAQACIIHRGNQYLWLWRTYYDQSRLGPREPR